MARRKTEEPLDAEIVMELLAAMDDVAGDLELLVKSKVLTVDALRRRIGHIAKDVRETADLYSTL